MKVFRRIGRQAVCVGIVVVAAAAIWASVGATAPPARAVAGARA